MTLLWIIVLSLLAYLITGIPVGIYSRNRSVNKSFNEHYDDNKRLYSRESEEDQILRAMRDSERFNEEEKLFAGVCGTIFWPLFLVGFAWHYLFKAVAKRIAPILPKAESEKKVDLILQRKRLREESDRIIKIARQLGFSTEELKEMESIVENNR